MRFNKRFGVLAVLISSFFCSSLSAEIVYQDTFDRNFIDVDGNAQTIETFPIWPRRASNLDPNVEWYMTHQNYAYWPTKATAGEGLLTIVTEDASGGVISYPTTDTYDFFNQELTFTFDGVNIQALGISRSASQWVRFGVVANADATLWKGYPIFLVSISGSGGFALQVRHSTSDTVPRKVFRSNIFNFDVSLLKKIELTMNSTNYRVVFTFENPLDVLSFGGLHNLDRDLWFVDTVFLNYYKTLMDNNLNTLNNYQSILTDPQATQAEIDAAQLNVDAWQIKYDDSVVVYEEKLVLAEAIKGDSALMVSASSDASSVVIALPQAERDNFDANYVFGSSVGGRVTVNDITVETTNILQ